MMQKVRASSLKGLLFPGVYVCMVWKDSNGVAVTIVFCPVFVHAMERVVAVLSIPPIAAWGNSRTDNPACIAVR